MQEVVVGHGLVKESMAFARTVCASYQAGRKNHSRGLCVQGKPKIDNNPEIQYVGRVAEVATCIFLGLNPRKTLNWGAACDDGVDLTADGVAIDVKASNHPGATRLIWPVSKKHFMHKAADVLIFAKVPGDRLGRLGQGVSLVGWVAKTRFVAEAVTATGLRGIVDGTVFMDQKHLDDMTTLKQYIDETKKGRVA